MKTQARAPTSDRGLVPEHPRSTHKPARGRCQQAFTGEYSRWPGARQRPGHRRALQTGSEREADWPGRGRPLHSPGTHAPRRPGARPPPRPVHAQQRLGGACRDRHGGPCSTTCGQAMSRKATLWDRRGRRVPGRERWGQGATTGALGFLLGGQKRHKMDCGGGCTT